MRQQPIRVLVVDDYKPWQDLICSMLRTAQEVQVVSRAADGAEAVQKARELQPDLILMDLGLPTINGVEAALQVRGCVPKSQILFVSENRDADIVEAAMATGAVGYIAKSNAADDLLPALKAIQCCLSENSPHLIGTRERSAYEKIVDVAVDLMRSDYASVQELFPERGAGGELRLLAFRGFNPLAVKFWEWVRADSKSTCGIALRDKTRVVAPDIATCDFMNNSEDQRVYLQTGIRACQTTPLIARSGDVVGMISTHWHAPHQPSEGDFRVFDILARGTADVIAYCDSR